MNGLSGIRNINAEAAARECAARRPRGAALLTNRDQSEDRGAVRYQRQYVGNLWGVFDSATAQFGFKSSDVVEVDRAVDRLNDADSLRRSAEARERIAEQRDSVGAILATAAKASS